jgi:hypothetical protein
MARMNWGRVGRENRLTSTWDYSARLDDEERRLFGDAYGPSTARKAARRAGSPPRGTVARSESRQSSGTPAKVKRKTQAMRTADAKHAGRPTTLTKAERDRRTAEAWDVTVSELKAIRRRVAEVSAALSAEAKCRQISTKELRRQIENGAANARTLRAHVDWDEAQGRGGRDR